MSLEDLITLYKKHGFLVYEGHVMIRTHKPVMRSTHLSKSNEKAVIYFTRCNGSYSNFECRVADLEMFCLLLEKSEQLSYYSVQHVGETKLPEHFGLPEVFNKWL